MRIAVLFVGLALAMFDVFEIDFSKYSANVGTGSPNKLLFTGNIKAKFVIVEGRVDGDIYATESVSVRQSAKVKGNIYAPRVGIVPRPGERWGPLQRLRAWAARGRAVLRDSGRRRGRRTLQSAMRNQQSAIGKALPNIGD